MITRFAPSPTGPLHLGHAYSAMLAHDMAMAAGGTFLLRIEDIDQTRARPQWEAQILDDLHWLGLTWPTPVMRQSDRGPAYDAALDALWQRGLLYPCTCNRRDILTAASAPQEGAPMGPDGVIYPGTCSGKPRSGPRPTDSALRLDTSLALQGNDAHGLPDDVPTTIGDVVLARRDMGTSYHLSVVVDDAAQGVTHVLRGEDLSDATPIHILLQRLLGLVTPTYRHHRLIRDEAGKRLAKRDDARAIAIYRADGASPQDIRAMVGLA
ncbi:tRNA glutamyl-Q(34) synthetase GluQRS [Loktanella fryxellensis]|uniref:tRNA glutamyl-Q(34) synthetase GluQRS n=1 Tax=Loktanella fryxellensis TaxID=245187 RepID=UPI000B1471D8|nr:tRNA glutamyl-Q(34) synthetase GluQRS [Loktanella fryxellensis]